RKWEVVRSELGQSVRTEHLSRKLAQRTFQIYHRDPFAYHEAFHLMEYRRMRSIRRIAPVHAARRDDSQRRLLCQKRSRLNGRSLRSEDCLVRDIESVRQ